MQSILISLGVSAIMAAIKNPDKRIKLKKVMLDLRNAINAAYSGDPDFDQ